VLVQFRTPYHQAPDVSFLVMLQFRSSSSLRVARKMERRQTEVDLMELKEGDMFGECSLLANRLGPHSVGSHWDASIVSITHVQAFHLNQV